MSSILFTWFKQKDRDKIQFIFLHTLIYCNVLLYIRKLCWINKTVQ